MATTLPAETLSTIAGYQERIERVLERYLTFPETRVPRLVKAMRYATLGGGKRMRPLLVYATGEALGAPLDLLDPIAAAIEMIHVYSLIHDDLPAMDDDEYRRGKLTCHREFDEATAILAGDALQALAFRVLLDAAPALPPHRLHSLLVGLADAAGLNGMAGGQALDLQFQGRLPDAAALEQMHRMKTGALIAASVMLPAQGMGVSESDLERLGIFARGVGLAFQIQDDLLDVEGDPELVGKLCGADSRLGKATFPSLLGIAASRQRAQELLHESLHALEPWSEAAELLRHLGRYIVERKH
jgi:geranylgeranyl pyrophosphate synthase